MQITICGGGNAAHTLAGLLGARHGYRVHIFSPFRDEVQSWQAGISANGGITAHLNGKVIVGRPQRVSADPAEVVPGSSLVLLALPAFAHESILRQITSHLKQGAWVGALPARGGFDLCAREVLDHQSRSLTVFGLQTLPWACRIEHYGQRVRILGVKAQVDLAASPPGRAGETAAVLQALLGISLQPADSFLGITLANAGQILHPGLMFGLFGSWKGELYSQAPIFYQGVSAATTNLLQQLSAEIQSLRHSLQTCFPHIDFSVVRPLHDWARRAYANDITDASSLQSCLATNRSYADLTAPMRPVEGGLVPDFKTRYLSEDVPFGLVVTRGIAELAGMATPVIDEVILWAQERLGQEYLVNGKLQGRDLQATRAPQRYGIKSLEELIDSVQYRG